MWGLSVTHVTCGTSFIPFFIKKIVSNHKENLAIIKKKSTNLKTKKYG